MNTILHLSTRVAWEDAQTVGEYRADSLATEGFIHCSTPEQIVGTANRHYHGRRDLLVLTIDADKLTAPLRYENTGSGPLFPHVYGPLNLDAVVSVRAFPVGEAGAFG